ncbi:MAG: hypothetical protein KR126chlam3_01546, partial [Chlamydiae bacterium]|nr:hypothetical protein [Chlamydiota bacterium]
MNKKIYLGMCLLGITGSLWSGTLTVTNMNDTGAGSLRDAITNASSGDSIVFDTGGTITLDSPLPKIDKNLSINGSGQTITIDGVDTYRPFTIISGTVEIKNLTIEDGLAKGGDGGNGGLESPDARGGGAGGGLGAGGAIFANEGVNLTVEKITFQSGKAEGGDGGDGGSGSGFGG